MTRNIKSPAVAALSVLMALSPALASNAEAQTTRITQAGAGANAASLVLPLGQSAIIDLPTDARDVLLSSPETADAVVRTARRIYVIGRRIGTTNAFFFDASGRQIASVVIRVEPDAGPLNEILSRLTNGQSVRAEAVNGSMILTGSVRNAADSQNVVEISQRYLGIAANATSGPQLVNLIQVEGSEQVLVRVRVVEMSRTLVRQLGINLNYNEIANQLLGEDAFVNVASANGFSVAGRLLGGVTASGGISDRILMPNGLTYPTANAGTGTSSGNAGVAGYSLDPSSGEETLGGATSVASRQTDASIQAFERAGLLRILAEPNLTAISGESARFLAGGEFPVPVAADNGQISVEFKPFGVGLAVTPVVLSGGRISLRISTEVSELTSEGAINTGDTPVRNADGSTNIIRGVSIPALQVRRAETTMEMPSGGAMVMAGLIRESTRHVMEGMPGAMNMPVLGPLFRSRDFLNNETELVIIVTPYLVRPTSPDQLRTPADGYRNPSEGEANFLGRLNTVYRGEDTPPSPEAADRRRLQGPSGHVIP